MFWAIPLPLFFTYKASNQSANANSFILKICPRFTTAHLNSSHRGPSHPDISAGSLNTCLILPFPLPSVLNAAEKWAFSVRFQTMWLQLSEPSCSFLPRSTWEHKPWQRLTRSCHDWPHGHLWLLMLLSHWPPWLSSNVAHSTVRPTPHLLPAWRSHPPSLRGSPRALKFCLCLTFSKLPAPLSLDLPCLPTHLLPSSSFSPCFIYYFSL